MVLVLIENQIERTDHKHLGQLLTYGAGLQSVVIVWVAAKFADEHRKALDWLNEITDEKFRFFGLEVELWKIGNSCPAPKFNIISQPNNWSKNVAQAVKNIDNQEMSETRDLQYRYWQNLVSYLENNSSKLRPQNPQRKYNWLNFSIGRSGFRIVAVINSLNKIIFVQLLIKNKNAKNHFTILLQDKDLIEKEMGCNLEWKENSENMRSNIILSKNAIIENEENWQSYHQWFSETIEKFDAVFRNRVKNL